MDYTDEPEDISSDYFERARMYMIKADLLEAQLAISEGDNDTWKMINIDIEKIKKEMKIQ